MWAAGGRREFRLPQPKATLGAERPAMEGADYTRRRGQCKCSRSAAARALNRGSESPAAGAPAPPLGACRMPLGVVEPTVLSAAAPSKWVERSQPG